MRAVVDFLVATCPLFLLAWWGCLVGGCDAQVDVGSGQAEPAVSAFHGRAMERGALERVRLQDPVPEVDIDCPQFDRCALWVQCARSGDSENHHANGLLVEGGWQSVDERWLSPFTKWYEAKFRKKLRIILHLPFGKKTSSVQTKMHFYGGLDAVKDKKSFFTEDFVRVIRPYTEAGHEVIVYLGSPHNTTELQQELVTAGRRDDVVRKMWLATRLALECDCSIAFDNMGSLARSRHSEATYWFLNSLTRTYVEATVERHERNEAFWNEPAIVAWRTFSRRHDDSPNLPSVLKFPQFDSEDWYGGEVLVLLTGPEVPSAERASVLASEIKGFKGVPVFQTEGFEKIVKAWPAR